MEEKTEAVKSEETTFAPTMSYNPFSYISGFFSEKLE